MPSLRNLQHAFGTALIAGGEAVGRHVVEDGFSADDRLGIYRNSCRATLVAALRLAFPAVERIVGRDFFDEAAGRFALAHPPTSAYLNAYGGGFADFLAAFPPAEILQYLADVARFEWALGLAANADDAPFLDAHAAAAIDPAQEELRFVAHPSMQLLLLRYPADRIADAVLGGDDEAMRAVDLGDAPVRLVVHRGPRGVEAERLDVPEYEFLVALCAGAAWSKLAETQLERAGALLAEQLRKGRLTGFRLREVVEDSR